MMLRVMAIALTCLAVHVASAGAQEVATLERSEELAQSGRFTEARAELERWRRANPETANTPPQLRARALVLAGRLATDANVAMDNYRAAALSYPSSAEAAEALLRLGQGLIAQAGLRADREPAQQAVTYLSRLVSDHPRSPHRAPAVAWLARAHVLAGQTAEACRIARTRQNDVAGDVQAATLLRATEREACTPAH
jgi:TolA-binding protein